MYSETQPSLHNGSRVIGYKVELSILLYVKIMSQLVTGQLVTGQLHNHLIFQGSQEYIVLSL